jgi:hypothetical protein
MTTRYDICTPRKGRDDKTYWTRIGTAFQGDKGIQLIFDALPIADSEGRVVANLFEPRERTGGGTTPRRDLAPAGDLDDDVPFISSDPSLERGVR